MPAISFQSVSKTFSFPRGSLTALDAVSFDIGEGEFFGLLGPNGAGKTPRWSPQWITGGREWP